ncbi:MAG: hypothetical protein ABEJ31_13260 [Haloarculaceae archaeon]
MAAMTTERRTIETAANEREATAAPGGFEDKNDVFHLLQSARRRAVVRYFDEYDGPVEIGDLADRITAW